MTAMPAQTAPKLRHTSAPTKRPALRPVAASPGRLSRVPFLLVLASLLGLGLVGVLILNTTIQAQQSQLRNLERRADVLYYQEQSLLAQVDQLRSSTELGRRAIEIGMKPNPHAAFLQLPDGFIIGNPQPVTGGEAPGISWVSLDSLPAPVPGPIYDPSAPGVTAGLPMAAPDPVEDTEPALDGMPESPPIEFAGAVSPAEGQ